MYLRIVKASLKPGQVEELARHWEALQKPRLQALPGFRHAHLGGDRAGNRVLAVTAWDTRPDPAMAEQAMREFAERVRDLLAGPPTPEEYEVLVEA